MIAVSSPLLNTRFEHHESGPAPGGAQVAEGKLSSPEGDSKRLFHNHGARPQERTTAAAGSGSGAALVSGSEVPVALAGAPFTPARGNAITGSVVPGSRCGGDDEHVSAHGQGSDRAAADGTSAGSKATTCASVPAAGCTASRSVSRTA